MFRWTRGFASGYNISDQVQNISSVRSRNSSNRSSTKSNLPSEEKDPDVKKDATMEKLSEKRSIDFDSESISSQHSSQLAAEGKDQESINNQGLADGSFETDEKLSECSSYAKKTNEEVVGDTSCNILSETKLSVKESVSIQDESCTDETTHQAMDTTSSTEKSFCSQDISIEVSSVAGIEETTFTNNSSTNASVYVNVGYESNEDCNDDGIMESVTKDIEPCVSDNETACKGRRRSQSVTSHECSSLYGSQSSENADSTSKREEENESTNATNSPDKLIVVIGVPHEHSNQNSAESSPINRSSRFHDNYGAAAQTESVSKRVADQQENEQESQHVNTQPDQQNEAEKIEELVHSRFVSASGSRTIEKENKAFAMRSASFHNMKDSHLAFDSKQSVRNRHGNFQARNASFYSTIQEEPTKGNEQSYENTNTLAPRRHQRFASDGHSYPVLYNRKASVASYAAEERRNYSFYRDRRRPTVTSEKSICTASSRRASNTSIALERQYQQERSTFTQLCLVNISFMVGYIPITVYLMWTSNVSSDSRYRTTDYWFGVVAYMCLRFSECMNPIIYNYSSGNIRDATKRYLRGIFQRSSDS